MGGVYVSIGRERCLSDAIFLQNHAFDSCPLRCSCSLDTVPVALPLKPILRRPLRLWTHFEPQTKVTRRKDKPHNYLIYNTI